MNKEEGDINKSKNLAETDGASYVIDKLDPKEEEEMVTVPRAPDESVKDETLTFLLGTIEEYSPLIAQRDCLLKTRKREATDLYVDIPGTRTPVVFPKDQSYKNPIPSITTKPYHQNLHNRSS